MKEIRKSLSRQLTLNVSALLLLFAIMVTILFSIVLRAQVNQHYRDSLLKNAYYISVNLSENYSNTTENKDLLQQLLSKENAIEVDIKLYERLTQTSIYIVDLAGNVMIHQNDTLRIKSKIEFPDFINTLISSSLKGANTYQQYQDQDRPMMIVSTPITNQSGEIIGIVLLNASIQEYESNNLAILALLVLCLLFVLTLVLMLAAKFSNAFTLPIQIIKKTAVQYSEQNYNARSSLSIENELGELSKILDGLGSRLELAKKNDEHAEELRRDFLSTISHELKTPVTIIRGYLEAINDNIIEPKNKDLIQKQMLKECVWLQQLISELLDLTRLESDAFQLSFEKVSLSELMSDVVMSAYSLANKKAISIIVSPPKEDLFFIADYQRLRQMLMILLDNAIKFTPHNKSITIEIDTTIASISITDQGCGIKSEHLEHIFDKFYRVNSNKKLDSTGLGLSIAKEIANRHQIVILANSTLDIGSTFTLLFPNKHNKS